MQYTFCQLLQTCLKNGGSFPRAIQHVFECSGCTVPHAEFASKYQKQNWREFLECIFERSGRTVPDALVALQNVQQNNDDNFPMHVHWFLNVLAAQYTATSKMFDTNSAWISPCIVRISASVLAAWYTGISQMFKTNWQTWRSHGIASVGGAWGRAHVQYFPFKIQY